MQKLQLVIISVFLAKHVTVMNYKSCQCASVTLLGAFMKAGVHFFDMCHFHSPDAADSTSFDVQLGDIILTATDGLFDNMPDYMILQELKKLKNSNYESIQQTARSIAEQAHELAYDPTYMSPFAQFACDNGLNVRGGKPDDITVLLSIVAEYTD